MAARQKVGTAEKPPASDMSYRTGEPIDGEAALGRGVAALRELDPAFVDHLLAVGGKPPLRRRAAGLEGLAAIIVAQQVSTASAAAIFGRLAAAIQPFEAAILAAADDDLLRGCGLSIQKIRALRSVAAAIIDGSLCLEALAGQPAEAAVRTMVSVKGIGPWTADVFLLFCLGHPDAWPAGDIALQEAARVALRLDVRPDAKTLHRIGERWRPHRAVAARLLWSYYRAVKQNRDGMLLAAPTG
ncbi:MAG TPA: DNA-3-methyladenine glycosylase 2 family protein [Lichenihabitans sp.]|nr:DNA-3-methyladenine glycosylase 2 family protein [Lichenihabitans sp.]